MTLSGYVEKMLAALADSELSKGNDPDTFRDFVQGVGRQIRPPFAARHAAPDALGLIDQAWDAVQRHDGDGPLVCATAHGSVTRLITVMPDQPFIVDTVRLAVTHHGGAYLGSFNVVVPIHRAGGGVQVGAEGADGRSPSC